MYHPTRFDPLDAPDLPTEEETCDSCGAPDFLAPLETAYGTEYLCPGCYGEATSPGEALAPEITAPLAHAA